MKILFLFLGIATCTLGACKPQQEKKDPLLSFVQAIADSVYKKDALPGICVGVLDSGIRHYYTVGFANSDKKIPFDSATLFEVGSITKTFTAYILESVLNEKNISDTSSIFSYLPEPVQQNSLLKPITFLSLMNHSSGLPRLPDNMDLLANFMTPYDNYDKEQVFEYLKTCIPKPDGKSNYSNLGAGLGGMLAERISGLSYMELLNKYIYTAFNLGKANEDISNVENKATGYFQSGEAPYWNMNALGPAYVIKSSCTTLLDYLQYMALPANKKHAAIIDNILQPTLPVSNNVQVCKGWFTLQQPSSPTIYWHNGGTYGFSTFAGFVKGQQKAVVIVINKFNKNNLSDAIGVAIMKKLLQ